MLYGRGSTLHVDFQVKSLKGHTWSTSSSSRIFILFFQVESGMRDALLLHMTLRFFPLWVEVPSAAARMADRFPSRWVLAQAWLQSPARLDGPNQTPLVKIFFFKLSGSVGSGALWRSKPSIRNPLRPQDDLRNRQANSMVVQLDVEQVSES